MRRLLIGLVVATATAITPVLAFAGNQETAEQIKSGLEASGHVTSGDAIGVKFQDGTAYLSGHIASREQMNATLKVVYQTPGVTRIVNNIVVAGSEDAAPAPQQALAADSAAAQNPLREQNKSLQSHLGRAQRVESTASAPVERVPSTYTATPLATVSAEESVAEPQQVVPQKPRPMAANAQRVAMRDTDAPTPAPANGAPLPMYAAGTPAGPAPVSYDQPRLPNYAWPSYAAYPNYAAVTYPKQYSASAWPYVGPFYPYPQVPLGWRRVSLEWSDGWWFLDFKDQPASAWQR